MTAHTECCVACVVPNAVPPGCLNISCRCHWYEDPVYSGKIVIDVVIKEKLESPKDSA